MGPDFGVLSQSVSVVRIGDEVEELGQSEVWNKQDGFLRWTQRTGW